MARKKKNKKKNKKMVVKGKRRPLFQLDLLEETKRKIYGVLMFFGAIIVSLSFFNLFGKAGRVFMQISEFLIGKAVFLLPLLFVLGGIVFFKQKYEPEMKIKKNKLAIFFGIIILIVSVSGIFGILSLDEEAKQGGWLGYLTSVPLIKAFGVLGTTIIFIAVIIIGGLILWQISPSRAKKEKEVLEEELKKEEKPEERKPLISKLFKKREAAPEIKGEKVALPIPEAEKEIKAKSVQGENEKNKISSIFKLKTKPLVTFPGETYQPPPLDLLAKDEGSPTSGDIKVNSTIIKRTLQNFDIPVEMSEVNVGPTVTQYTFKPAEGVKLSKITSLNNDLSLALAAHPIRIEAPIPGRSLVGIELPNKGRSRVGLRNLLEQPDFQNSPSNLTFTLGRDVAGNPVFADLDRMPHLLVAGSTGSGKTICLNNIVVSLLYRNSPESLRFILVDPKRVEFSVYNGLPHFLSPVILTAPKTVNVLKWLITEMERRFDLLSEMKARDITGYNKIIAENKKSKAKSQELNGENLEPLPYIVLIIDELADVMAARGREVEAGIVRLAQMSRAVGIHLIVATQRPSVEVITGLIKANITSRIAFQVASQVDSRTILDMAGAEKLLGLGDMLFISSEIIKPKRIQGAYISEKEVRRVSGWLKKSEVPSSDELEEKEKVEKEISEGSSKISETNLMSPLEEALEKEENFYEEDPLYEEAKKIVIESKKASASLLQRRLRLGYARAARLIDTLEERGIVGPAEGAKPREVYISKEEDENLDTNSKYEN